MRGRYPLHTITASLSHLPFSRRCHSGATRYN